MPRRASAKRYAQALFDIGSQRDRVEQWVDHLDVAVQALENGELQAFLENAKIPLPRKVQAIEEILPGVEPPIRNLLSLLVSRGLVDMLPNVEKEYLHLVHEMKGREQVEVRSAVPLEDGQKDSINRFLTALINKEVVLESRVDPSILGGLVIRIGDRLIDGSTRTRLDELGKRLQRENVAA